MSTSTNKTVFFLILSIMYTAGSAYAAVEQMSSKWTAAADDDIKVIASGDVDGDNVSEIVAATQKRSTSITPTGGR